MGAQPRSNWAVETMRFSRTDLFGSVLSCVLGLVVFLQYDILQQPILLDPGYFMYMGQRILLGFAPYATVFDHKTPLASFVGALAMLLGRVGGVADIVAVRLTFLAVAVLCVGFTYFVARTAFTNRLVGLFSALVILSFSSFGVFAVAGIEPKILMIALGLISLHAIQHEVYWLGGMAAALSFLSWQGGGVFMVLALLVPAVQGGADRTRSLLVSCLGMLISVAALAGYFQFHGALGEAFRQTILFNFGYMHDKLPTSMLQQLEHLRGIALYGYGTESWFFVLGLLGWAVWAGRNALPPQRMFRLTFLDPKTSPFLLSWYALILLSLANFQGVPDYVPLLPYLSAWAGYLIVTALEYCRGLLGRVASLGLARRGELWLTLVAVALVVLYGTADALKYDGPVLTLAEQKVLVDDLLHCLSPDDRILVIGAPEVLVLSQRANALRYIYFYNNVDAYAAQYERGGFEGLIESLNGDKPALVVYARRSNTGYQNRLFRWFERNYDFHRLQIPVARASLCPTCVQRLTMVVLSPKESPCYFNFPVGEPIPT